MVLSSLPQRSSWGSEWWMCTWKTKSRQIPSAMQRYIPTSVNRRDSNISKNGAMVGDAGWVSSLGLILSFFWRLSTKTAGQLARRGAKQTIKMGWWWVGQKLTGGVKRAMTLSSSKACKTWQWRHRGKASLLYLSGNATVIPTDGGRD
jgi:hypothetical protein